MVSRCDAGSIKITAINFFNDKISNQHKRNLFHALHRPYVKRENASQCLNDNSSPLNGRGTLVRTASIVGALGLMSKVLGVVREGVIASKFGTGPTVDAFSFASSIPLLFVTSIGGINGALHTAITTVSRDK